GSPTPIPPARAEWTASGVCSSGSSAPLKGATRRPPGGAATTSTTRAERNGHREIAMTTGPTPALMKQINEAFNSRDVDRIMAFFEEDCAFLMARGPEPEGRRVHGKADVRKVRA